MSTTVAKASEVSRLITNAEQSIITCRAEIRRLERRIEEETRYIAYMKDVPTR